VTRRGNPVICLDCNTAIAAFQKDPPPTIAMHRDRVRYFIQQHYEGSRLLFPAIALSEYLWKAEQTALETEILRVVSEGMFAPAFDQVTASIAANLGRRFVAERKSNSEVARFTQDRVVMRADLLIVATALQHSAKYLLTNDDGCLAVATFAKIPHPVLIRTLPDPPPPSPPPPVPPASPKRAEAQGSLFPDDPE
jgi:predicted nucleic acid-binding protein